METQNEIMFDLTKMPEGARGFAREMLTQTYKALAEFAEGATDHFNEITSPSGGTQLPADAIPAYKLIVHRLFKRSLTDLQATKKSEIRKQFSEACEQDKKQALGACIAQGVLAK